MPASITPMGNLCHISLFISLVMLTFTFTLCCFMSFTGQLTIMTWISEKKLTWYENVCMNVLKTGQVPRHVAFIMDGNRRYAKRNHIEKTEGHARG